MEILRILAWPIVALVGIAVVAVSARFVYLQRRTIVFGQQANHQALVNVELSMAKTGVAAQDAHSRIDKLEKLLQGLSPTNTKPTHNLNQFR